MKHCKNCGAQLADDDDYCYFCGKPLEEEIKEKPVFTNHDEDSYVPRSNEYNGIALAGLILAFFSPIIGLILSCIGLNKSKQLNGLGRGQAIAGIIVSIINFALTLVIYFVLAITYNGEV